MLDSFHTKHGVTKEMIEKYIGFQTTAFTEQSLLRLGQIWNSLKDGMTKREDYFDIPQVASDPKKSVKTAKTADEMSELEKSEEESGVIPQTNGKGK
jgi:hypothetical protein